jgi:spore coat polysaccharide biosynthesis predicted glycosyltransferase SpsG
MKVLFRVDAGGITGLGHFYRSVSLANKLRQRGHSVYFVFMPTRFWSNISKSDFLFKTFEIADDKPTLELDIIDYLQIDIFFVDGIISYESDYLDKIKKRAKVVFYQNLSSSKNLADIFILPSINPDKDFFKDFSEHTIVYKGLEYFTFNENILNLTPKQSAGKVSNIGIIAGGSDPKNTMHQIIKIIDLNKFKDYTFNAYLGVDQMYRESAISRKKSNIKFYEFDHSDIMKNDFLISAFGVSTYEFLALGMPILAFGHQPSNAITSDYLAMKTHSLISLGLITSIDSEILNNAIYKLIHSKETRQSLTDNSKSILDLKGPDRIIDILENIGNE